MTTGTAGTKVCTAAQWNRSGLVNRLSQCMWPKLYDAIQTYTHWTRKHKRTIDQQDNTFVVCDGPSIKYGCWYFFTLVLRGVVWLKELSSWPLTITLNQRRILTIVSKRVIWTQAGVKSKVGHFIHQRIHGARVDYSWLKFITHPTEATCGS